MQIYDKPTWMLMKEMVEKLLIKHHDSVGLDTGMR